MEPSFPHRLTVATVTHNRFATSSAGGLAVAKENQRLVERFKDDENSNRARAKTVADEFVSEFLECRRNRKE